MNEKNYTRREFIASGSALLAASQLPTFGQAAEGEKLALHGGSRAVKQSPPRIARWGEPERQQLEAMLRQDSLLYWKSPQTTLLIERFKQHHPCKYVMTCSSGTAAIHIAVAAAGVGPGDEVITTPITDIGTVIGVLYQQGVPIFADLEPHTYNLDVADVERRITPKTKAIIAVHLSGTPSRLNELKALCDKHNLVLIEDAAQAWGAKYRGQPVGTIGHMVCFSLQNSKQVTCGDGGVVASNDERFGPLLHPFGDKGVDRGNPRNHLEVLAPNYRMSEPQAAVAAAQMNRLEEIVARRSSLGNLLTQEISGLRGVTAHEVNPQDRSSYWLYMIRVQPDKLRCSREEFVKALQAEGVSASPGYIPELIFEKAMFQKHSFFAGRWPIKELGLTSVDYTKMRCPEANAILKTCVRITVNEAMDEDYIRSAAAGIRKVANHFAA